MAYHSYFVSYARFAKNGCSRRDLN